tara:strand:- start:1414 stop:1608 length:195 start_codon:yes stop_codon:yes gene_type:complete
MKSNTQMNNFEALQLSNEIQEQIELVGDVWELSNFEITALCGIVSDAFAARGITMQQTLNVKND